MSRRVAGLLVAGLLAVASSGCSSCVTTPAGGVRRATASVPPERSAGPRGSVVTPPGSEPVRRTSVLGYSVHHRPIVVTELGDPGGTRRLLVVGCIHGNEQAGIPVAQALATGPPLAGVDMWIVPDLNPDGVAASTRGNADGVDLNRNFPKDWQPLDPAGGVHYAGPAALSEPESRALHSLTERVRPTLGVWFHQALRVVDISEGPLAAERTFASLVGLPTRVLPDYPGSAVGWENAVVPSSAFAVEMPAGFLSAAGVRRYVTAVRAVAAD
jgi:protein MpaA